MNEILNKIQYFFLFYFIALHLGYIFLMSLSVIEIWKYVRRHTYSGLPSIYTGLELPVSIVVPAYNEATTIADSVKALLQLTYSEYEVIVVNDGSNDGTLDILIREFQLEKFPEAYRRSLPTQPIRDIYASRKYQNVKVIDKENGGKADALNAGINLSHYPLFCAVDADSILQSDSLEKIAQPFLEDPTTVAAGGTVRIANGCIVENGFLVKAGLPRSPLALLQVAEYLRAFLFGRLGWSPLNALLIVSGAFGLFRKAAVIEVGGYRTDTIGEDMELIVRMHRIFRSQQKPYRIVFVPDPICWTEAPEDINTLRNQRIRWQRGLTESLMANKSLLFSRNGGTVGWLAMPYMFIFEWLGPVVELVGFLLIIISILIGTVAFSGMLIFFTVAVGFGVLLSVVAVFLEELSFHIYPKSRYVVFLLAIAIVENVGYRQINTLWRIMAMFRWARGKQTSWGKMKRTANWQQPK